MKQLRWRRSPPRANPRSIAPGTTGEATGGFQLRQRCRVRGGFHLRQRCFFPGGIAMSQQGVAGIDDAGDIDWNVCVDATNNRAHAHQHQKARGPGRGPTCRLRRGGGAASKPSAMVRSAHEASHVKRYLPGIGRQFPRRCDECSQTVGLSCRHARAGEARSSPTAHQ